MNYTQNKKIKQVKKSTLVVGIDIAKHVHVARAQDYRGIQYGKALSFENNILGFETLLYWIKKMEKKHCKTETIVGMEPTGHYWLNLEEYLSGYGIKLVLVNPAHVKKSKTLDDNSPTKTDKKDARVIAQLVKDGRYSEPNIPKGIYADLRSAITHRERLTKDLSRIKAKIHQWLDKYFPDYLKKVFNKWDGKASLAILKEIPLPEQIVQLSPEEIVEVIKKSASRGVGIKRAKKLKGAALNSIGITEGLEMAVLELKNLIQQYELLTTQLTKLEDTIIELLEEVPGAKEMLSINGIGAMTVAGFIAEIGDINNYNHNRQIIKLAGLNLKENSSGQHKGQTTISKRGRPRLRSLLYKVTLPLIRHNDQFKAIHEYYTKRPQNPLKSQQSRIALCCKLIRVFFALGKKQVEYDGKKMMNDIKRNYDVLQKAA
ncbi:IS110 family RNA-guided transposase [Natronospora cellulosivora (SeqCode)]